MRKTKTKWERGRGGKGNLHTLQTEANHWFRPLGSILFHADLLLTDVSIGGCYFPSAAFS